MLALANLRSPYFSLCESSVFVGKQQTETQNTKPRLTLNSLVLRFGTCIVQFLFHSFIPSFFPRCLSTHTRLMTISACLRGKSHSLTPRRSECQAAALQNTMPMSNILFSSTQPQLQFLSPPVFLPPPTPLAFSIL